MSEWKKIELGNFIKLKRGYDLPDRLRKEGEIPIYSSSGISGFHNESKVLPPGVITGRYGTLGNIFLANEEFWPLNTTLYVEDFKGNYEVFTYYFLKNINWNKFSDKSAVPGINRNDVHKENVLVPCTVFEQKQIADVLSALDRSISNLRKQNETVEKIAQTLFKHWFVDFEFPNEDGKPYKSSGGAMVRSDLGEIPVGWRVGKLGDMFSLKYGKSLTLETRVSGQYPVVGSSGIVGNHQSYLVKAPGIVIGRKGTIGQVIWLEENFYPIDTTFYVEDILGCNDLYFYFFLLKRQNFQRLTSDSAVPGLNRDAAYSVEIATPQIRYIDEFNTVIKAVFNKINLNKKQIQTLTKTRDRLLPQLMSGKLRITD